MGFTNTCLKERGTIPEDNEELISFVITGKSFEEIVSIWGLEFGLADRWSYLHLKLSA